MILQRGEVYNFRTYFDPEDYNDTAYFKDVSNEIPLIEIPKSFYEGWFSSTIPRYPIVRFWVDYDKSRWRIG